MEEKSGKTSTKSTNTTHFRVPKDKAVAVTSIMSQAIVSHVFHT